MTRKTVTSSIADKPDSSSSAYERNKLRIAGALNLLGDVFFLSDSFTKKYDSSGKLVDKTLTKITGGLYTAGALVATLFGRVSAKEQANLVKEQVAELLERKAPIKSQTTAGSLFLQKRNQPGFSKIKRFMQRYAGQIMLWLYTLGAGVMMADGVRQYRNPVDGERPKVGDLLVGSASLLVKVTSALMPEQQATEKDESEEKKKKGLTPMKLFGVGSFLTELFWAYSVYERQRDGDPWKRRAVTTASYMASDVVIATTNKDTANAGNGLQSEALDDILIMAVETIAAQPPEAQANLKDEVASVLAKHPAVSEDKATISAKLEQMLQGDADSLGQGIATSSQSQDFAPMQNEAEVTHDTAKKSAPWITRYGESSATTLSPAA